MKLRERSRGHSLLKFILMQISDSLQTFPQTLQLNVDKRVDEAELKPRKSFALLLLENLTLCENKLV
jgi:hypothetical protein